jgi:hypothetical protein
MRLTSSRLSGSLDADVSGKKIVKRPPTRAEPPMMNLGGEPWRPAFKERRGQNFLTIFF